MKKNSVHDLSDEQLLNAVNVAAACEREATAHLISLLAEMDARQLHLGQGYSSLFAYCTKCLRLSEHAAYGRIEAARAARRFPLVLERLADGSITLTTLSLLATHLTSANHRHLLNAASQKSKREVEQQIAALRPQRDVPSTVRKLPCPHPMPNHTSMLSAAPNGVRASVGLECESTLAPAMPRIAPPVIRPLAPERYKVQFTVGRETHDKLRRVQDLLRHLVPHGDPAAIFDRALTLLLEDLERKKLAQAKRPRDRSASNDAGRHVPAAVKRKVWARDEGQCAFIGADGRCGERGFLEFHHMLPFADGGLTTVENLQLRCRAHNAYEAREYFDLPLLRESSIAYELGPALLCQFSSSAVLRLNRNQPLVLSEAFRYDARQCRIIAPRHNCVGSCYGSKPSRNASAVGRRCWHCDGISKDS